MMMDVAAFLEREKAKAPKEWFYSKRPLYLIRLLNKQYINKYEPPTFLQYEINKGSIVEHVKKFIDTMVPYAGDKDLCLCEFSKSLCDRAYTWYTGLKPRSIPT